jgi:hypothetical protein
VVAHEIPTINPYQALAEDRDDEVSNDRDVGLSAEWTLVDEPKIIDDAWDHSDPSERKGWERCYEKET